MKLPIINVVNERIDTMLQDEYYLLISTNNPNYPSFAFEKGVHYSNLGYPLELEGKVNFRIRPPYSKKRELVDYHIAPHHIISPRFADLLAPLNIYGIQFLPAILRDHKYYPDLTYDYVILHIWNRIACVDKQKSEIDYLSDDPEDQKDPEAMIFSFDKLVLCEDVLQNIKLEHRLMFELKEKTSVCLVHESIKNIIELAEMKGLRFLKVSDWNSDSFFD